MTKSHLISATVVFLILSISIQTADANDKTVKDDRDKLGMSTITIPGKTHRLTTSMQVTNVIDLKVRQKPTLCDAELDLTYYQIDSIAEVTSNIVTSTCPENQGSYRIRLFYKSAGSDTQRIDRELQWSTTDGNNTAIENFTLGDGAELLRVNSSIIHCECMESAPGTEKPD